MIRFWVHLLFSVFILGGCSSSSDLLEKWSEEGQQAADSESLNSPEFHKLNATLSSLGYQGIGMRYEATEMQQLLNKVFTDGRVAGRQIKLVYTGLALSYDPKHASLTIGGTTDPATIISYIEKQIPKAKN